MKLNCYHSRKFKTINGVLLYVNGLVDVVKVDPMSILSNMCSKLIEKNWKLEEFGTSSHLTY